MDELESSNPESNGRRFTQMEELMEKFWLKTIMPNQPSSSRIHLHLCPSASICGSFLLQDEDPTPAVPAIPVEFSTSGRSMSGIE
jgi:hypothetical protein